MRRMLAGSLLACAWLSAPAYSAPAEVVAKRPNLVCPQAELADKELQDYRNMWDQYSKAVDDATKNLLDEIDNQTKSATDLGNIDLVDFWTNIVKAFTQKGEVRWDKPSLKKEWKRRFGDAPFPEKFDEAVKEASDAYAAAQKDLENGYEKLVVVLTKASKLEEARKVREELKKLLKKLFPPRPDPDPKPVPPPPNPDPLGAAAWNGHKYKVFKQAMTWHEAQKKCKGMGGHLVTIGNAAEQKFVVGLLGRNGVPVNNQPKEGGTGVWLGATDEAKEGAWVWVDGSPFGYANWAPKNPDNRLGANYVVLLIHHDGLWSDRDNDPNTPLFICEWDE